MYIHIGYTLSPKKEVGVGEEESSGIGEVEVVVREMFTGHVTPTSFFGERVQPICMYIVHRRTMIHFSLSTSIIKVLLFS